MCHISRSHYNESTQYVLCLCPSGIVLLAMILSISINQSFLLAYKTGMHCRVTLSAAIYQKILSLSQVTIGRLSVGHVVNLASNDVHRLDMVRQQYSNIACSNV